MGYITMWLQLLGFSDWLAGLLTALFWGGTVAGNLLGGLAGDLLVRRLPHAGARPGRVGYRAWLGLHLCLAISAACCSQPRAAPCPRWMACSKGECRHELTKRRRLVRSSAAWLMPSITGHAPRAAALSATQRMAAKPAPLR